MLAPDNDEHPDSALAHPTSTSTAAGAAASASAASAGRRAVKRRKSNASASSHRTNPARPSDDDKASKSYADDSEEEEEPPSDREEGEADGGEYVDEEEVENAIANGTPTAAGRKAVPWGRKHIRHEPDDEDDELMIYAKVPFLPLPLCFSA